MSSMLRRAGALVPSISSPKIVSASEVDATELVGSHYNALLIPGAVVWPEFGVAIRASQLIEETVVSKNLLESYLQRSRLRRLPIVPVRGTIAALNVGSSHKGYFHQWIEALPRAWVIGQLQNPPGDLRIVITQELPPEFHQLLVEFLPDNCRIRQVPRSVRLKPRTYLHAPVPFRQASREEAERQGRRLPAPYIADFRRTVHRLFDLGDPEPVRLYVTRSLATARHLRNDTAVREFLEARGFTTVALENLTIREQAKLFDRAKVIVAQHGAALTNLMYCRPGATVVEIFNGPSGNGHRLYRNLANQLDLDYNSLELEGPHKDATVDLPLDLLSEVVS